MFNIIPSNIRSNVNLQKERTVTLEGHGEKRVMQQCRGFLQLTTLSLLGVVSFKAGSTSGVLMFPGYVGGQTTTPPPYYATTGSYTTKAQECYTTIHDAPSCNTESRSITLRVDVYAVSHYALKYYSAPSYYTTKGTETLDYACCPILPHPRLLSITLFLSTY